MYLSYFLLDITQPSVRQCLRDANDLHRSVMRGFHSELQQPARASLEVLFRLMPAGTQLKLYVLSHDLPIWLHLPAGFNLQGEIRNLSDTINSLVTGRRLAFDLLASPTKKIGRENANSRRVFLSVQEDRADWLASQACKYGFTVLWSREDGQSHIRGKVKDGEATIHYTGVRFRGELRIDDEITFRDAFRIGVGPGKPYGLGMLMLFPSGG